MSGKGDTPRPYSVDDETFAANWDAIFGKAANDDRNDKEPEPAKAED